MALKGPNLEPRRFHATPFRAPPTPGLSFVKTDSFQSIQVDFIVFYFSAHAFHSLVPLLFQVTAGDEAKPCVRAEAGIRSAPFTLSWRRANSGKMSGEGRGDTTLARLLMIHNLN